MLLEIFDPKAAPKAIGIDLGTTNSLVAFVKDGDAIVIEDCDGISLLPSVVSYGPHGQVVVGRLAEALRKERPTDTLVSVKRFMGRGADETQGLESHYVYVPDEGQGGPSSVRFKVGGDRVVTPVEASAEILKALKRLAEDELRSVGGAVITVPAYFDDAQRQATRDAARLAGLEVLRLINEPTAAALAYGLESKRNGLFVVYDLGGGTFDVTVLRLEDFVFQVRSTGGDSQLGGDDMDAAIATMLLEQANVSAAARQTPEVLHLAHQVARQVKHGLTDSPTVQLDNPFGDEPALLSVTREAFETAIRPLLERTGRAARRALRDADIETSELDGVILVGGSTRVPAVRAYVEQLFGREALVGVDPDKVVALGAALHANELAGQGAGEALLLDVTPLSLGIEVGGGVVDKIIPRNSSVPASARSVYTTQEDKQTGFVIHVVQGERDLASDCRSLARFVLKGIPPMPAGMARLEVHFEVNADGLLKVNAREQVTGVVQAVEVKPSYGLDDETVEKMLMDSFEYAEHDFAARKLREQSVEAARILHAIKDALVVDAALLEAGEEKKIRDAMATVEAAVVRENADAIRLGIEDLDAVSKEFAGRRMNEAFKAAFQGKSVGDIETRVESALGIDEAHARHGVR